MSEPVYLCENSVVSIEVVVPSSSGESVYKVSGVIVDGSVRCECPGFQYRATCRHLRRTDVPCGWRSDVGEPMSIVGKCPRCGCAVAPQRGLAAGVSDD